MQKGSGLGMVLFVGIVFFVMEYTDFPSRLAEAMKAWGAYNPTPTTVPSTTAVINAAGTIDTAQNAATTNVSPITGGSVQ